MFTKSIQYRIEPNRNVINISTYIFIHSQLKLLNNNINSCSQPRCINKTEISKRIQEFETKFKVKA